MCLRETDEFASRTEKRREDRRTEEGKKQVRSKQLKRNLEDPVVKKID